MADLPTPQEVAEWSDERLFRYMVQLDDEVDAVKDSQAPIAKKMEEVQAEWNASAERLELARARRQVLRSEFARRYTRTTQQ